jgi:8-oxo-dGTP diphosphatase
MAMMQSSPIQVVAGIFHRENPDTQEVEVLLFQQGVGDVAAGMWEFPGGKLESSETQEQALIRELQEEISITVTVGKRLGSAQFQGHTHVYELTAYFVQGPIDKIVLLEHQGMKWVGLSAVVQAELALGDRPLIKPCFEELQKIYGKK